MLVRVRSNVGVWRVDGLEESTATVSDLLEGIAKTRPHVVYEKPLSSDQSCQKPLDTTQTLSEQSIQHGSMIYCRVDPSTCVEIGASASAAATVSEEAATRTSQPAHGEEGTHTVMRRVIDKDGAIKLVPTNEISKKGQDKGFRKGMLPLRDMKMQWTLADFVALDSQYEFKIKRQETAVCKQVSLDVPSITSFQAFLQRFQFQRRRFGICYGRFIPDEDDDDENKADSNNKAGGTSGLADEEKTKRQKAMVEAIYEPPQEVDPESAEGFVPLDDPNEARVDEIAQMLGLTKVGWIFGHEAREAGYVLSSAEVIMAAEYQLEVADGLKETPFVTIKVAPGRDGTVSVEAFQVSQQCMAMVAEEALEVGPDPKFCVVNETFTAIQEGKESKTVENNFFLTVVPIVQHTSETFVADFPRLNRDGLDDRTPSNDELKRQLQKAGSAGWTFVDRLADFNLLIYVSQFFDLNSDMPKICASIVDKSVPLDDGYKLLIKSMAGLDGSY